MKKWRKQALFICSMFLFLTGCSVNKQELEAPRLLDPVGVQGNLETVERRELYHLNYAEGEVIAYLEPVFVEDNAIISEVHVALGDHVKKGDVLCEVIYANTNVQNIEEAVNEYEKKIRECQHKIGDINAFIIQGNLDAYEKKYQQLLLSQEKEKLGILEEELKVFKEDTTINTSQTAKILAPIEGDIASMADIKANVGLRAKKCFMVIADSAQKFVTCELSALGVVNGGYEDYILVNGEEATLIPYTSKAKDILLYTLDHSEDINVGEGVLVFRKSNYKDAAISVSNDVIYSDDNGKYVYVKENGEKVRRNIMVGNTYTTYSEIIDGLSEGDEVYVQN